MANCKRCKKYVHTLIKGFCGKCFKKTKTKKRFNPAWKFK
tara:strand:+ start:6113 stop:6232 length:120 start_codon:yes stop_codon:yes gene_type:complete